MCRWIAYSGTPIYLHEALFEPEHSLIDQSLRAKSSETTTNGDGFGIGWYNDREFPGIFKDVRPAWNDSNLQALSQQIKASLFMAHIRAATVGAVQRSNCHPFCHENWLFVHNGAIEGYERIRRDLMFAIAPELFNAVEGTTDSEIMFYLALTFGMQSDVASGIARMAGYVEMLGEEHGIENPLQMTLGISDGESLYAFRYSSARDSRSLFNSTDVEALEDITPEADRVSAKTCAIVSEPLTSLADDWREVPESSFVTIAKGKVHHEFFEPRRP
jgi:predicted glutamine amidotransferase